MHECKSDLIYKLQFPDRERKRRYCERIDDHALNDLVIAIDRFRKKLFVCPS